MRRKVSSATDSPPLCGLVVIGQVRERTRRMVPLDNPRTEIVTYMIIDDNDHRYYVDDYAPSSYYETGANVGLAVYVKPYKKRNGELSYTICVQKDFHSTKGEVF